MWNFALIRGNKWQELNPSFRQTSGIFIAQNTELRITKMTDKKLELQLDRTINITSGKAQLDGELKVPQGATGIVLFAHGSGSSRHSPRNQYVARTIREAGVGTLLFDLLTKDEEALDSYTGHLRFNIEFLAGRLVDATNFVTNEPTTRHLRIGYFGSSTGAAAALIGAVKLPNIV